MSLLLSVIVIGGLFAFGGAMIIAIANTTPKPRQPKPPRLTKADKQQAEIRELERQNAELDNLINKIRGDHE